MAAVSRQASSSKLVGGLGASLVQLLVDIEVETARDKAVQTSEEANFPPQLAAFNRIADRRPLPVPRRLAPVLKQPTVKGRALRAAGVSTGKPPQRPAPKRTAVVAPTPPAPQDGAAQEAPAKAPSVDHSPPTADGGAKQAGASRPADEMTSVTDL